MHALADTLPLAPIRPRDPALPFHLARLPDDCLRRVLEVLDAESVPCLRAACRAFRAAASQRRDEPVSPALLVRSSYAVAAWAWGQPAFRDAVGTGFVVACAELGYVDILATLTLATISINGSELGPEGARCISAALVANGAITSLGLWRTSIGDVGVRHVSDALVLNVRLTRLDLRHNCIGPAGAAHLAYALCLNTALTSLTLYGNPIGDVGAGHLGSALSATSTLTKIDLRVNAIGPAGAAAIAMGLRANASVRELDLGYNPLLTDAAKDLVRKAWRHGSSVRVDLRV
ncbi:hypothetical protein T492DRAFT_944860 [Pavlovales sp. CCMP2436]|nr:hypothetical protein T492DRAFT_944860 [Pavlovales sp. CCMP2436]